MTRNAKNPNTPRGDQVLDAAFARAKRIKDARRHAAQTGDHDPLIEARIADIAATHLVGIETLETRNSDRLDFHEVSVATLRQALRAAYLAGHSDALEFASGRPIR